MSEVYENDDSILARLSLEFVDAARDQLDDIDAKIEQFEKGEAEANDALLFIQREVHNIKGQGATFGFPLTGRIAHMLEDFLINANGIRENNLIHIRFFWTIWQICFLSASPKMKQKLKSFSIPYQLGTK